MSNVVEVRIIQVSDLVNPSLMGVVGGMKVSDLANPISLLSKASGLINPSLLMGAAGGKREYYAVAWISPSEKRKTLPSEKRKTRLSADSYWDETLELPFREDLSSAALTIEVHSPGVGGGWIRDPLLGALHIPLSSLASEGSTWKTFSYQLQSSSGTSQGCLTFMLKLPNQPVDQAYHHHQQPYSDRPFQNPNSYHPPNPNPTPNPYPNPNPNSNPNPSAYFSPPNGGHVAAMDQAHHHPQPYSNRPFENPTPTTNPNPNAYLPHNGGHFVPTDQAHHPQPYHDSVFENPNSSHTPNPNPNSYPPPPNGGHGVATDQTHHPQPYSNQPSKNSNSFCPPYPNPYPYPNAYPSAPPYPADNNKFQLNPPAIVFPSVSDSSQERPPPYPFLPDQPPKSSVYSTDSSSQFPYPNAYHPPNALPQQYPSQPPHNNHFRPYPGPPPAPFS